MDRRLIAYWETWDFGPRFHVPRYCSSRAAHETPKPLGKLRAVPYPEQLIAPMRADLTRYGLEEARTSSDVDRLLEPGSGTVLMW